MLRNILLIIAILFILSTVSANADYYNDDNLIMPESGINITAEEKIVTASISHDNTDIRNYLEGSDLDILAQAFTSDGITLRITSSSWADEDTNLLLPLEETRSGKLVIVDPDYKAAFSMHIVDEAIDIVGNAEYVSVVIKPTVNKNFKIRLNFWNPETKAEYSKEIDFGDKLIDDSESLIVVNVDELRIDEDDGLVGIDFRLGVDSWWKKSSGFPGSIAGYLSDINFIGEVDSE